MTVEISSVLLRRILALAEDTPAVEICGLLLGAPGRIGEIAPATNVSAAPARRFELDPQALFAAHRAARNGGPAVLGHYHSHPSGRAEPSARDAAAAHEVGALWLIVAAGEARLWRVSQPGTFVAVPLLAR